MDRSLVDRASFQNGMKAYVAKDFASAANYFDHVWQQLDSSETAFGKLVLATRLVESWCRSGDSVKAVTWFKLHGDVFADGFSFPNNSAKYWVARSLLEAGEYKQSGQFFAELSSSVDFDAQTKRKFEVYQAHALFRSGAPEAAYRILFPEYSQPVDASEALFFAGITYETKRFDQSIEFCQLALDQLGDKQSKLKGKAVILLALCLDERGFRSYAISRLLELIDQNRDIVVVCSAFDVLRSMVAAPVEIELVRPFYDKWLSDQTFPNRQILTQFSQLLLSTTDEIELNRRLSQFVRDYPNHFISQNAKFELAKLDPIAAYEYVNERDGSSAMKELLNFVKNENAFSQFQSRDFKSAGKNFSEIEAAKMGKSQNVSLFNSAIAALLVGKEVKVKEVESKLSLQIKGSSLIHADLLFAAGVYYASKANPLGFDYLSRLIQDYPGHSSLVEAKLALAEMHLNQVPSNPSRAKELLEELLEYNLSNDQKERVGYAQIWVELLNVDSGKVQDKITVFLIDWPNSDFRAEVMMLLATEFYESQQFDQAREKFQEIARDFPESRLRDTALFFAAKSTDMYERLGLPFPITSGNGWDSVIQQGGRFANHARHQKAFELLKMDKFSEAIRFLDEVLSSDYPVGDELYISAKCDKAFCYYMQALAQKAQPDTLKKAAEAFESVATDKRANRAWRYQASVRRGKCLEQMGDTKSALAVYRKIVDESKDQQTDNGRNSVEENNWLFRAGFRAIEILETKKDWKGAVQLADMLAQKNAQRSNEAAQRAENLRLQYFVWD